MHVIPYNNILHTVILKNSIRKDCFFSAEINDLI